MPYSQRYLVLGLVGLALWLVSGIALNKYRCEYGTLFQGLPENKHLRMTTVHGRQVGILHHTA